MEASAVVKTSGKGLKVLHRHPGQWSCLRRGVGEAPQGHRQDVLRMRGGLDTVGGHVLGGMNALHDLYLKCR